jgi:cellulose synthase operon protein YhjQ
MSRADDVASLFQRFGASSDGYLEIENTFEYREPAVTVAQPAMVNTPAPAPTPASQRVAPPQPQLPVQPEPTSVPTPPVSGPLGNLLAEVALARQAEAAARTTEVLVQAMSKEPPALIEAQVIAVISAKGGVGKTTLSAALASTVRLPGGRTVAIDLDPQNALRHHLSVSPDTAGMGSASLTGENWNSLLLPGSADTCLLPYGSLDQDERRTLELFLENDPRWLVRQIARMGLGSRDVVVLDVPCGDARMLEQTLNAATQILVVVTADAACYLTLDRLEGLLAPTLSSEQPPACGFVLNQFEASRAFSRDMAEVTARRLGERLLGVIHKDHGLGEALAYGHNPLQAPGAAQGVQDLLALSDALMTRLTNQGAQESLLP